MNFRIWGKYKGTRPPTISDSDPKGGPDRRINHFLFKSEKDIEGQDFSVLFCFMFKIEIVIGFDRGPQYGNVVLF